MKIKLLLLILLLNIQVKGQWYVIDTLDVPQTCPQSPPSSPVSVLMEFTGIDTAYYFGATDLCSHTPGHIISGQTSDNYKSWHGCYPYGSYSSGISGSYFLNNDTGFVCAWTDIQSYFTRTFDGGNTWTNLFDSSISCLYFVNANLGFGLTEYKSPYNTAIWKFHNDSLSIIATLINSNSLYTGGQIVFADEFHGFMLASAQGNYSQFKVLRTIDGGITWTNSLIDSLRSFYDISFSSSSIGYIASDTGIYKTTDGGLSWNLKTIPNVSYIFSLSVLSDLTVFATSSNVVIKTFDGGNNWKVDSLPDYVSAGQIKMFNDSVGFILASKNTNPKGFPYYIDVILKTMNGGEVFIPPIKKTQTFHIQSNPNNGIFTISVPYELSNSILTLNIYNDIGKLVQQIIPDINANIIQVNISDKAKGLYFVQLISGSNNLVGKVIKE